MSDDTPGVPQNVDKSPIPEDGEQPLLPQQWNDDGGFMESATLSEAEAILSAAQEVQ